MTPLERLGTALGLRPAAGFPPVAEPVPDEGPIPDAGPVFCERFDEPVAVPGWLVAEFEAGLHARGWTGGDRGHRLAGDALAVLLEVLAGRGVPLALPPSAGRVIPACRPELTTRREGVR